MLEHIIVICVVLTFLSWMWINYIRSKKMIREAKEAVFPTNAGVSPEMQTINGKVEVLSFQSKSWKTKRLLYFIASIFILITIGITTLFEGDLSWTNLSILILIPLVIRNSLTLASFVVLQSGVYIDECFYDWDDLYSYQVSPLKIGSEAYGMFDNSAQYTEIKFFLDNKNKKSFSVYVRVQTEVDKIRQLCREFKVIEVDEK
ncbi:hypothetical protein SAMN05421736_101771 [Evansella caseinilytica]|uniref:DUF5673 domain-containing protein n=1 Tax=Evansella caseinilytica TaxID=1503961 RepID=A0A1H3IAX9_9BACI|nr:hypothetical protein [Evansella caseinilytica]SDY24896.1 hypothetical protein SAMN05421736_101771 [Evansella caseinilytica]